MLMHKIRRLDWLVESSQTLIVACGGLPVADPCKVARFKFSSTKSYSPKAQFVNNRMAWNWPDLGANCPLADGGISFGPRRSGTILDLNEDFPLKTGAVLIISTLQWFGA